MQRDRFVTARMWLRSAERDSTFAKLGVDAEPALAAFHAQQAAERALKGLAIAASDDHARTHSIAALLIELRSLRVTLPEILEGEIRTLDAYYLAARYPDAVIDGDPGEMVPVEDARRAIDRSDRVRAFAGSLIERLESEFERGDPGIV